MFQDETEDETLRRPSILLRAARHGMALYDRNRDLRRLTRMPRPPGPAAAVAVLRLQEAEAESRRQAGDAGYSLTRHVDLLIALLCELRLLRATAG